MSLQFVFGASGSGKSSLLYQTIIEESIREPDRLFLVIVPEQFTLQTQRELVMRHPCHGILNIDVLSFQRLAYRVMEQTGTGGRRVLTETGKNLILRKVAGLVRDQLQVLGGRLDRQGMISLVKSMLSELSQYGVGEEQLSDMIELSEGRSHLKQKLSDLLVLMRSFDRYRQDRFMTGEEVLQILADQLPHAASYQGCSVVLDSFTGFTPLQMGVLSRLLTTAESVRVALTLDPGESTGGQVMEQDLFYLTKKTVQGLSALAAEAHVPILEPLWPDEGAGRFRAGSGLKRLQENLLHYRTKIRPLSGPEDEPVRDIRLIECPTPAAEAAWAAQTIRALVFDRQVQFREIAVIAGSMSAYEFHLAGAMEEYEIPYFIDHKVTALRHPMMEMIRASLEMARTNLSYESVMRFLRTGLSTLAPEEADLMDHYLLAKGIRGIKAWQEEWIRPTLVTTQEDLETINRVRAMLIEKLCGPLAILQRSSAPVSDYVGAVRQLSGNFCLPGQMEQRAASLRLKGDEQSLQQAMEYDQITGIVDQILDEAGSLLDGEIVSGREFSRILDAGFEEAKVGLVPPGMDQVYIGDLQRTRLSNIRVLLFVGMNDGYVPGTDNAGSLLSQADRTFLLRAGCALAPDARTDCYIQRFYQYQCLTKASEQLFISWSRAGSDGSQMKPSYLVHVVRRLFEELPVEKPFEEEREQILSDRAAFSLLADSLREEQEGGFFGEQALLEHLENDPACSDLTAALKRSAACRLSHPALDESVSASLYGETLSESVSRMESFAGCPYQYFARYGLQLKEREEYRINAADIGSLLHDALAIFSEELTHHPQYSWQDVPEQVWKEMLQDAIGKADANTAATLFRDSGRGEGTFARLERILHRSVWGILEQIRAGSFAPSLFEYGFRRSLPGMHVSVTGKIDRIDLAETDGKLYVKIVDYKTGEKKFQYSELFDGRDIQLALYQQEALELVSRMKPGTDVRPAGMFYTCVKDPLVEGGPEDVPETAPHGEEEGERSSASAQGDTSRLLREKQLKECKPAGLMNRGDEVLPLYAKDPAQLSLVSPAGVTSKGNVRSSTALLSEKELRQVSAYATKLLVQQSEQIRAGKIEACPYRSHGQLACAWCSYGPLCGYDRKLPGARIRSGSVLTDQQILERITADDPDNSGA